MPTLREAPLRKLRNYLRPCHESLEQRRLLTTLAYFDFSDANGNADAQGFVTDTANPNNPWHLSTGRGHHPGHSAEHSWYFGFGEGPDGGGRYSSRSSGSLRSPEIDLSRAASAQVSVNQFVDSDRFLDSIGLWAALPTGGSEYISIVIPSTGGEFRQSTYDLSSVVGKKIQLTFGMTAGFRSTKGEGWYVDDVQVDVTLFPHSVEHYEHAVAQFELVHADSTRELVELSGPITVHSLWEGASSGDANDNDLDGLDEVQTLIVGMDMHGTSSLGPISISLAPNLPSEGVVQELSNQTPGLLEIGGFAPGSASVSTDLYLRAMVGGQMLHHVEAHSLSGVFDKYEPGIDEVLLGGSDVALLDDNSALSGLAFRFASLNLQIVDYGDAPDTGPGVSFGNYRTLASDQGASHVVGGPRLGQFVDAESDGQPGFNADGDDNGLVDDDDGVSIGILPPGQIASVDLSVTQADGFVSGWIDFNQNGAFEASEQVLTDHFIAADTISSVDVTVPAAAVMGDTYARFRVSSATGLGSTGQAVDGEVEDYMVRVRPASTIDILGTSGDDVFDVAFSGNFVEVTRNGTTSTYSTAAVGGLNFDGLAGNDSIRMAGSLGNDRLQVDSASRTAQFLLSIGLDIHTTDIEVVRAAGSSSFGHDQVLFVGSDANDRFKGNWPRQDRAEFSGGGFFAEASEFDRYTADVSGDVGNDLATLLDDTDLVDYVVGDGDSNSLELRLGSGPLYKVIGFNQSQVTSSSNLSAPDQAMLLGSASDDTLVASDRIAILHGAAFYHQLAGFSQVVADVTQSDGQDQARLLGTSDNGLGDGIDTLVVDGNQNSAAIVFSTGASATALGFEQTRVDGNGGLDTATLDGTSTRDFLTASVGTFVMKNPTDGYHFTLTDFEDIAADGGVGNERDQISFRGSAGDDKFYLDANVQTARIELDGAETIAVSGIETILGQATSSGFDQAFFNGSAGNDNFTGNWQRANRAVFTGGGMKANIAAFDYYFADVAGSGGSDRATLFDISNKNDLVTGDGANNLVEMLLGNGVEYEVRGFDQNHIRGTNSPFTQDRAEFSGTPSNDTLVSNDTLSILHAADYYFQVSDFAHVVASVTASGGDDRSIFRGAPSGSVNAGHDQLIADTETKSVAVNYHSGLSVTGTGFRVAQIDGGGEKDDFMFHGASTSETITVRPASTVIQNLTEDFALVATNFEGVQLDANGGVGDLARVFGTTVDDWFHIDGAAQSLQAVFGDGTELVISGVENLTAESHSSNGADTVSFAGGPGNDQFIGNWRRLNRAMFLSGGMLATLVNFDEYVADVSADSGYDHATLFDLANASDQLLSDGDANSLQFQLGNGTSYKVIGFNQSQVHATPRATTNDVAQFSGSNGDDILRSANGGSAVMYAGNYYHQLSGFGQVLASLASNSGTDRAFLNGSGGIDWFSAESHNNTATLTRSNGESVQVVGFDRVQSDGQGGNDHASLQGSSPSDMFTVRTGVAVLKNQSLGYEFIALNFEDVITA